MVLIVRSDLVEFVLQRPHPRDTVHELEMTFLFVVHAGVVDDGAPNRLVYPPRDLEGDLGIVEPLGPGVLVVDPQYLTWFAQHSADSIEEHRLAVSEMEEDKSDGPL